MNCAMKTITFRIPTSWNEVKMLYKERTDKRYIHNQKVLKEMYAEIIFKLSSNYWSKDISDYFRKNFEYDDANGLKGLLNKYLKQLK